MYAKINRLLNIEFCIVCYNNIIALPRLYRVEVILIILGATGFEPATSASQMPRSSQTEPRPEIFRLHAPEMHFCAFYLLTHFGFDIHWIKSNCVYLHQFSPLIAASTLRFKCLRQFFLCFRVKQEPRPLTRTLEIII